MTRTKAFGFLYVRTDGDHFLLDGRVLIDLIKVGDKFMVCESDEDDALCKQVQIEKIVVYDTEIDQVEAYIPLGYS